MALIQPVLFFFYILQHNSTRRTTLERCIVHMGRHLSVAPSAWISFYKRIARIHFYAYSATIISHPGLRRVAKVGHGARENHRINLIRVNPCSGRPGCGWLLNSVTHIPVNRADSKRRRQMVRILHLKPLSRLSTYDYISRRIIIPCMYIESIRPLNI